MFPIKVATEKKKHPKKKKCKAPTKIFRHGNKKNYIKNFKIKSAQE